MNINSTNRLIWQGLFQAAMDFRDMAPWRWMYDADIFGVQDPESGEIGWCCIMGAGREVFALAVYTGQDGFSSYLDLANAQFQELEETDQMALVMNQKLLKVEFVNREEIDDTDQAAFKSLGLKFRGPFQWIQVRNMSPGYYPWYLSDKQAIFMTHCLRQAMDVAARFQGDEELLSPDDRHLLVRISEPTPRGLKWSDLYMPDPEYMEPETMPVNAFVINRIKKELKRQPTAVCYTLDYVPNPVLEGPGETRPFFPKLALWIAYKSGYILGMDMFTPKQFGQEFELAFAKALENLGFIPEQILVNSLMAQKAVEPFAEALEIELILAPEVADFKAVRESMGQFFDVRRS